MIRFVVYRCFDGTGRLLYVGSTRDLGRRLREHHRSPWWDEQVRVDWKPYPTRGQARTAERNAIGYERPLHNIVGRADRRRPRSAA